MRLKGSCHCRAVRFSVDSETPYLWDKRWPEWIYPFASAIDTPLPRPRERQHVFLASKPAWVDVCAHEGDRRFRSFPREAIIDWHRKRKLLEP